MPNNSRLHRLAALRRELGLDAVLLTTPANLYYFSGFHTTLYTRFNALLAAEGQETLVTSYVDEQLAKQQIWGPVWVRDIRIHGPIQRADVFQNPLDTLREELGGARRIGVDGISFALYRDLAVAFPQLDFHDVSAQLNRLRAVKDAGEVEFLRHACGIAVGGMAHAREVLSRPGVSEMALGAELEFHARLAGADGYGYPILISAGEKITAPHSPPSDQEIRADVPFVRVAFAPTWNGYCSSIIRTFCPGKPPAAMQRLADAYFTAMRDIEAMLRPGATVQDILGTVAGSYERSGVRDLWGGDMGYSVGVTVHEPPRIGGTDATPLAAGMVLAIMPGLRKPGEATFHHADVYLVKDDGCECLSPGLQEILTYEPAAG